MKLTMLHQLPALWASTTAPTGLRSGLALSEVGSTVSKSARKQIAFLQKLIHETIVFVNKAC